MRHVPLPRDRLIRPEVRFLRRVRYVEYRRLWSLPPEDLTHNTPAKNRAYCRDSGWLGRCRLRHKGLGLHSGARFRKIARCAIPNPRPYAPVWHAAVHHGQWSGRPHDSVVAPGQMPSMCKVHCRAPRGPGCEETPAELTVALDTGNCLNQLHWGLLGPDSQTAQILPPDIQRESRYDLRIEVDVRYAISSSAGLPDRRGSSRWSSSRTVGPPGSPARLTTEKNSWKRKTSAVHRTWGP